LNVSLGYDTRTSLDEGVGLVALVVLVDVPIGRVLAFGIHVEVRPQAVEQLDLDVALDADEIVGARVVLELEPAVESHSNLGLTADDQRTTEEPQRQRDLGTALVHPLGEPPAREIRLRHPGLVGGVGRAVRSRGVVRSGGSGERRRGEQEQRGGAAPECRETKTAGSALGHADSCRRACPPRRVATSSTPIIARNPLPGHVNSDFAPRLGRC
jgi:hypothetical protein